MSGAPKELQICSSGCLDQLCRDNIRSLSDQYIKALIARQKASPDLNRDEVVAQENFEGKWSEKADAEVQASKVRVNGFKARLVKQKL